MSRSQQICINDVDALRERLESSKSDLHWQIGPDEAPLLRLTPSMIQLTVSGVLVNESPVVTAFKQFICDAIGDIDHCRGTTLTANGVLTLSQHLYDYRLCIEFEYSELPSIDGSSEGGCTIDTSFSEFFTAHQIGG